MITRKTPNANIVLNRFHISDLFFNADHPAYDAYCATEQDLGNFEQARAAALLEDATAFAGTVANQVEPEWLVEDFIKRL